MKNPNMYVSIVIIIIAIIAGTYLMHRKVEAPASDTAASTSTGPTAIQTPTGDQTFAVACDDNKTMTITVHLPDDKSVDVALSDGRTLTLANVSTSDAVSYQNADGSIVLAVNGPTLSLVEGGTTTYANCAVSAAPTDATNSGNY